MVWHVKKANENEQIIAIEYSCENDESCDGLLIYDKSIKEFSINRLSKTADENATKRAFCPIYHLLKNDGLTEQKRRIATG